MLVPSVSSGEINDFVWLQIPVSLVCPLLARAINQNYPFKLTGKKLPLLFSARFKMVSTGNSPITISRRRVLSFAQRCVIRDQKWKKANEKIKMMSQGFQC